MHASGPSWLILWWSRYRKYFYSTLFRWVHFKPSLDETSIYIMILVTMKIMVTVMVILVNNDDDGYPAYSHHDKIPPWWENVSNDEGGNVSVSKTHHTPWWIIFWSIYVYQVTHITSGSFGMNFQVDLSFFTYMVTIMVAFGLEDNDKISVNGTLSCRPDWVRAEMCSLKIFIEMENL